MTGLPGPVEAAARVLTGTATTAGYFAAWRVVRLVPEWVARAAFDRVADRVYAADGGSIRRLRANLARAVDADELEETVAAGVRGYFRYWCESFRLPSWPTEDLVARTSTEGEEHLVAGLAAGHGVVAALPHMGNWDWAGAWATATHAPLMTVAERLRPERLFDAFLSYREGLGMHVLPLTGSEPPVGRLEAWLREGGLTCLLSDRDLSRSSVPVTLLGERARFPVGPAVLARRTGAALLPVTLRYVGEGMHIRFHAPVEPGEVTGMTQAYADAFTDDIRRSPRDWHMMQRVFEADLRR